MSFNTALSGLNSATADLNVKSNNIANVNTTGFKQSRAEFADVYAVTALGSSGTAIGAGSVLKNVAQQFKQGNIDFTDNSLDLAISGEGFFALAPSLSSGEIIYTRAGAFGVNKEGYVVNSSGQYLRTFPVNQQDGTVTSTAMSSTQPLQLPASAGNPSATTTFALQVNLNAGETAKELDDYDPTVATSYNHSTSATLYDSLGNPVIATVRYVKDDDNANTWRAFISVDDAGATLSTTQVDMTFDSSGNLTSPTAATAITVSGLASGAANMSFSFNQLGSTQFTSAFNVNDLSQNGYTTGRLTGIDISDTGLVKANYSNGQSNPIGKVALATFPNAQGLSQIGNTAWVETIDSGEVLAGEAGTGSFGSIQAGALESSNIDLTKELVGLITAQRNFQANSKAIETNNAITQTIINLR
jgi:flagellar hook protein FlgE